MELHFTLTDTIYDDSYNLKGELQGTYSDFRKAATHTTLHIDTGSDSNSNLNGNEMTYIWIVMIVTITTSKLESKKRKAIICSNTSILPLRF